MDIKMDKVKLMPVGDSAVSLSFGNEINPQINSVISNVTKLIKEQKIHGIVDMIPAFCSLLVSYDPRIISYKEISKRLLHIASVASHGEEKERVVFHIPVCYEDEFSPDMHTVMENSGLSRQEVIDLHASKEYLIYMLGFLPGFTYLGGLDERLHTPRLANPRLKIEAGSVGIGGTQTGIYPLESPGGWQLIGSTPIKTYDPMRDIPILVEAGQFIKFVPITKAEYFEIKEQIEAGTYKYTVRRGGTI